MDFGPAILALIAKLDPITLVLVLIIGGCGYYHVIWRREDREDKGKLLETVNKQTEAINGLKMVIAAVLGKPV